MLKYTGGWTTTLVPESLGTSKTPTLKANSLTIVPFGSPMRQLRIDGVIPRVEVRPRKIANLNAHFPRTRHSKSFSIHSFDGFSWPYQPLIHNWKRGLCSTFYSMLSAKDNPQITLLVPFPAPICRRHCRAPESSINWIQVVGLSLLEFAKARPIGWSRSLLSLAWTVCF